MAEGIRAARRYEAEALTALARRAKASWGYPPELMDVFQADLVITAAGIERGEVRVIESDSGDVLGVSRRRVTLTPRESGTPASGAGSRGGQSRWRMRPICPYGGLGSA